MQHYRQMKFKVVSIPSDISPYLAPDERVVKVGKSGWEIYVTERRVLFKRGGALRKEIVEASYRHISSIEFQKRNRQACVGAGVVLVILPFILNGVAPAFESASAVGLIMPLFFVLGIILLPMSLLIQPSFKLHIMGRSPLTIPSELGETIETILQYRAKAEAESPKRELDIQKTRS